MKKAIKEILLVLIFGLIIFTTNACANVLYEVTFVPGATPTDVFGRNYQYEKGAGIEYQGIYEVPIKYALSTITPIEGKENTFILHFLNSSEPLYLGELLKTNRHILKVKLLKILSKKVKKCKDCKRLRRSANKDGICDECHWNRLYQNSKLRY